MITTQAGLDAAIAAAPDEWHEVGNTRGRWLHAYDGARIRAGAYSFIIAHKHAHVAAGEGSHVVWEGILPMHDRIPWWRDEDMFGASVDPAKLLEGT